MIWTTFACHPAHMQFHYAAASSWRIHLHARSPGQQLGSKLVTAKHSATRVALSRQVPRKSLETNQRQKAVIKKDSHPEPPMPMTVKSLEATTALQFAKRRTTAVPTPRLHATAYLGIFCGPFPNNQKPLPRTSKMPRFQNRNDYGYVGHVGKKILPLPTHRKLMFVTTWPRGSIA